jgi:hypothetical protein
VHAGGLLFHERRKKGRSRPETRRGTCLKNASNGPLKIIASSLKQAALPGIFLWSAAGAILASYLLLPGLRDALAGIADLKTKVSYLYSFISTGIFAGLIPGLYLIFRGRWDNGYRVINLLVLMIFWGYRGIEVDFLYRLQGIWFSNSSDIGVVLTKVCVDQFLYSPFLPALQCAFVYGLMENHYHVRKTLSTFDKGYWTAQYPAIVLTNWMVWIPSVSAIYAMPAALQIPFANIISCFWSLLLDGLTEKRKKEESSARINT